MLLILQYCRSLYRERGLKFGNFKSFAESMLSLPLPGAWIEIFNHLYFFYVANVAPFTGSVDWNGDVEIGEHYSKVAPFTGSVDWNNRATLEAILNDVAPFTGSVDWNISELLPPPEEPGRSLYRERGLKYLFVGCIYHHNSRSLYRERGLKYSR